MKTVTEPQGKSKVPAKPLTHQSASGTNDKIPTWERELDAFVADQGQERNLMSKSKGQPYINKIVGGGLRITALEVRNLWGIEEAVIRPGERNIIRGPNATGKTSLLNAIQLALGGGSLGKYQRLGSEESPQIMLEISGPLDAIRIEREGDKPAKVLRRIGQSEAYEKVPAPAGFLKGLFDTKAANPFAFLAASDDERAQLLLEALDIEMDEAELERVLGEDASIAGSIPSSLHPLIRLALIHDAVYSARRGCNVECKGKKDAAEQLKRSVPAERLPDLSAEIARIEEIALERSEALGRSTEAADAELREVLTRAKRDCEEHIQRDRAEDHSWAAEERAKLERCIADRERKTEKYAKKHRQDAELEIQKAREEREKKRLSATEESEVLSAGRAELADLRAKNEERKRHDNTREQIRNFDEAAEAHSADSKRLSDILGGLETMKRHLAERLPVPGLDISGKEIHVNGVPWCDLNKAQQATVAGIVASERAKHSRLPVIFFDDAEHFDAEHIDAIVNVVTKAGAQLFAAVVVRDGELVIEADGKPGGSVRLDGPSDPTIGGGE